MSDPHWVLVVPLKDPRRGKTRLAGWLEPGPRAELVRAMVADTLAAAAGARLVERIIVVTEDPAAARAARRVGDRQAVVEVVGEPVPGGLNPAVRAGIDRAHAVAVDLAVGVLLGDLPALRAADLDSALAEAGRHRLAMVVDAAGTGTTLLTGGPGQRLDPAFGPGSAAAHADRGHVRVPLGPGSGLANDVDYPADLDAARLLGLGSRTRRVVARIAPLPVH